MIIIDKTRVVGWREAVRGMRNPMNSWDKSDSHHKYGYMTSDPFTETEYIIAQEDYEIGPNDYDLMKCLRRSGTDHRKFMRMIVVYTDILAPLYWWKEFDTYKVGTVANSCSTMHKIHAKEFTLDDFSHEHVMTDSYLDEDNDLCMSPIDVLRMTVSTLNSFRILYLKTKDKKYWWQLIQLLPSSYNQKRTVMLNYEVLANMFAARCNHKLDEWHTFCGWIRELPYSELITDEQ